MRAPLLAAFLLMPVLLPAGPYTYTGSPPIPVALEATTNLVFGSWTRLQTTNLTTTALVFPDGASSDLATRFYRVVGP